MADPPQPLEWLATKRWLVCTFANLVILRLYLFVHFSLWDFDCFSFTHVAFLATPLNLYGGAFIPSVLPLTHHYLL